MLTVNLINNTLSALNGACLLVALSLARASSAAARGAARTVDHVIHRVTLLLSTQQICCYC